MAYFITREIDDNKIGLDVNRYNKPSLCENIAGHQNVRNHSSYDGKTIGC